jgi:hypothetical protein
VGGAVSLPVSLFSETMAGGAVPLLISLSFQVQRQEGLSPSSLLLDATVGGATTRFS